MRPDRLISTILYYLLFFLSLVAIIMYVSEAEGLSFVLSFMGFLLALLLYVRWREISRGLGGKGRRRRR